MYLDGPELKPQRYGTSEDFLLKAGKPTWICSKYLDKTTHQILIQLPGHILRLQKSPKKEKLRTSWRYCCCCCSHPSEGGIVVHFEYMSIHVDPCRSKMIITYSALRTLHLYTPPKFLMVLIIILYTSALSCRKHKIWSYINACPLYSACLLIFPSFSCVCFYLLSSPWHSPLLLLHSVSFPLLPLLLWQSLMFFSQMLASFTSPGCFTTIAGPLLSHFHHCSSLRL